MSDRSDSKRSASLLIEKVFRERHATTFNDIRSRSSVVHVKSTGFSVCVGISLQDTVGLTLSIDEHVSSFMVNRLSELSNYNCTLCLKT